MVLFGLGLTAQTGDLAAKSGRAKQAMTAGRFQEAIQLYTELDGAAPGNAGLKMNLGLALHSAGRFRQAIPQFQAVLKLQPDLAPALFLLGVAYLRLGDPAKALEPLEKAVNADPGNALAVLELADTYLSLGRPEQAAARFRRLTEMDPQHPKGWQGLGLSYLALARREFESIAAETPAWYALQGRSLLEQQQYRTAFGLYQKALEGDPKLAGAHVALAEIYRKTGHPEWAAIEERREAVLNAKPTGEYARVLDYERQALDSFGRLEQLPETPELHELRAEAYAIQKRHKEAAGEWRAALRLKPNDRRMEKALAQSLWLNRDYEAARPLLERLHRAEPASAEVNHQLGDTLLQLGDFARAIPYLEAAVKLKPALLHGRASLARAYLRTGQPKRALGHLKAALPIDDDGSLHFQLSRAYERAGQEDLAKQAMEEFRRISRRQPEDEQPISAPR